MSPGQRLRVRVCCLAAFVLWLALGIAPVRAGLSTNLYPAADTGLFENAPTNNLGGMTFVPVGTTAVLTRCRALFRFDIAGALPANAIVNAVTLRLIVTQGSAITNFSALSRALVDWGEGTGVGGPGRGSLGAPATEGEATWFARFFSTNTPILWAAPGALAGMDFNISPSAIGPLGPTGSTNDFASPEMAADVQLWLNNPASNFGWILVATNESPDYPAVRVATREDPVNTPVLTIDYSLPNAPPVLTGVGLTNGDFTFSFVARSNRTYSVEFRGSPGDPPWLTLTNLPAPAQDSPVSILDPLTASNRFYRVRTP
jgi:hypothetical protein